MGRRATNLPEDPGTPGHFYFEPPVEIVLNKKARGNNTANENWQEKVPPVNLHSYRERTNCRTLSVRNGISCRPPENIAYLADERPNSKDIQAYHTLMRQGGFGARAVVTRRFQEFQQQANPQYWGIIIIEHHLEKSGIAKWYPYTVRWNMLGEIESAWGEDLLVVHAALSDEMLKDIFEAQNE